MEGNLRVAPFDKDGVAGQLCTGESADGTGLFETYFDRVYSLVFYSTGKDHSTAEEITRDTFLTALKSVKQLTGKTNLYTWLIGIANQKIVDYYRRLKREHKHRQAGTGSYDEDRQKPDLDFENTLYRLPVHYRQVLLLKYVEEMPVREICRIMDRSPKSVEGLLTRARTALKNK